MQDRTFLIIIANLSPRPEAATITKWSDETAGIMQTLAGHFANSTPAIMQDFRMFTQGTIDALEHLTTVYAAIANKDQELARSNLRSYLEEVSQSPTAVTYNRVNMLVDDVIGQQAVDSEQYGFLSQNLAMVGEVVLDGLAEGVYGVEAIADLDKTSQHLLWRGVAKFQGN